MLGQNSNWEFFSLVSNQLWMGDMDDKNVDLHEGNGLLVDGFALGAKVSFVTLWSTFCVLDSLFGIFVKHNS